MDSNLLAGKQAWRSEADMMVGNGSYLFIAGDDVHDVNLNGG